LVATTVLGIGLLRIEVPDDTPLFLVAVAIHVGFTP
jgi:hypothetical protein